MARFTIKRLSQLVGHKPHKTTGPEGLVQRQVRIMENIAQRLRLFGDLLSKISGGVRAGRNPAVILKAYRDFHKSLQTAYEESREILEQLEKQQGQRSDPKS